MGNLYAIAFGYSSMNNQMRGTAFGFDLQGNSSSRKKVGVRQQKWFLDSNNDKFHSVKIYVPEVTFPVCE